MIVPSACNFGALALRHMVVILGLVLGSAFAGADAGEAADPAAMVSAVTARALATLSDKQIAQADREAQFHALLEADFDLPRITRFVLGSYGNSASPSERQAFAQLFEQWIVRIYASGSSNYRGETIAVTGARASGAGNVIVSSKVIHPDGETPDEIDWILHGEADGFKIIDVNVEGISLVMTAREEVIAAIDQNGGTVGGANDALQRKLASADWAGWEASKK